MDIKIVALITMVFFISLTSAATQGIYDEGTKTMEIINLSDSSAIANITLKTDCDNDGQVDIDCKLMYGDEQLVGEFDFEIYQDYENAFYDLEFFDIKNEMEQKYRSYNYKYLNQEDNITVDNYEWVCGTNATLEYECSWVLNGTKEEEVFEWKAFNVNTNLTSQLFRLGLFADVKRNDQIDFVPTFFGIRVFQWASWNETFETGLVSYYSGNVSGSTVIDHWGAYNGTAYGVVNAENGIIGTGLNFTSTPGYVTVGNNGVNAAWTISLWANASFTGDAPLILTDPADANIYGSATSNIWGWNSFTSGTVTEAHDITDEVWYHLVVTNDGSGNYNIYRDGSLSAGGAKADRNMNNLTFARRFAGAVQQYEGILDEIYIYNRTLVLTEIQGLYNGGSGIVYEGTQEPPDTTNPFINITSPTNGSVPTDNELDIEYHYIEANPDTCWYSNDSYAVNTTLADCDTNITTITWENGYHNVTVWINDTSGNGNSSYVEFTMNYTAPVVTCNHYSLFNISSSSQIFDVDCNGNIIIGDGSAQRNLTLTSPDGTEWTCGVNNAGSFSCT